MSTSSETATLADAFISAWLEPDTPRYSKFEHKPLKEKTSVRCQVESFVAKAVFSYHNDPEMYRHLVKAVGFPGIAGELDQRPVAEKTRMGNFGEVLASEYLRQTFGYDIPVFRLRYNTNKNQSMKGDDVLAFDFGLPDGTGRAILVGESKARGTYDKKAVEDAYQQLVVSSRRPHPISLTFVANTLAKEGKTDKAETILSFLDPITHSPPRKVFLLFLLTGTPPRNPFEAIEEQETVTPNLVAVDLCIQGLGDLVKQLFEHPIGN